MPFLNTDVLDFGLASIMGVNRRLDICTAEPTTYSAATGSLSVGHVDGLIIGSPEARSPSGRRVVVPQVLVDAPGAVTGSGTATHWALSDPSGGVLLAAGPLVAGQVVASGNTWTTTGAFDIGLTGVE